MGSHFLPYHVLKAPQDSGSDDAQEEADDVEDGGGPEQVVEVDDILAAADVNVLIVATGDLHPAGRGEAHPVSLQGAGCPSRALATMRLSEKTGGQVGSYRKGHRSQQCTRGARYDNQSKCDYRLSPKTLLPARETLVTIS